MRHRIKPLSEVQGVHTHRLLAHRTLIRVSRRLVVVRKGDIACQSTEGRARMNLRVRILGRTDSHRLLLSHGNVGALRLTGVNVLDEVVARRRLP